MEFQIRKLKLVAAVRRNQRLLNMRQFSKLLETYRLLLAKRGVERIEVNVMYQKITKS